MTDVIQKAAADVAADASKVAAVVKADAAVVQKGAEGVFAKAKAFVMAHRHELVAGAVVVFVLVLAAFAR